ncbi:hypothetical protein LG047_08925 [Methylocystis sp. WRRC1]|uniref:hypothetical protein n=1 Tax=Methylocystis sp. WRRC1 TaxID=1732014 RepID=UPI001D15AE5B|nr:hypothetical protein [Methylocystis sp. WRRC1]MCC3245442.1 hypothetical protein [Methylocystis sp. WRRC1]
MDVIPVASDMPRNLRSRVSNGRRVFIQGDGSSAWARRWKDLIALHAEDLGGIACLSEAQMSLIRRAATLEIELERVEGLLSQGNSVDLDAFARVAGHLRRIIETLGVRREKRDVTPTLDILVKKHHAARAENHETAKERAARRDEPPRRGRPPNTLSSAGEE